MNRQEFLERMERKVEKDQTIWNEAMESDGMNPLSDEQEEEILERMFAHSEIMILRDAWDQLEEAYRESPKACREKLEELFGEGRSPVRDPK